MTRTDQEATSTAASAVDGGEKAQDTSAPLPAATPGKSKVGRPSQRNPGETRNNILRSALRCFTDKGFAATTFAAVARGAGVTGSAIYQYFDSKDSLYVATLEHVYSDLVPRTSSALIENRHFKDRLQRILQASADMHESNPAATAFLSAVPVELRRHPQLKPRLSDQSYTLLSALQQVFDDAKAAGEISTTRSTESLRKFFLGGLMGLCLYHHASEREQLREALEIFFDLFTGKLSIK